MSDEKPKGPEIDAHFIEEWVNYGFAEMNIYLVKQAQFAAYLLRHDKEEQDGAQ